MNPFRAAPAPAKAAPRPKLSAAAKKSMEDAKPDAEAIAYMKGQPVNKHDNWLQFKKLAKWVNDDVVFALKAIKESQIRIIALEEALAFAQAEAVKALEMDASKFLSSKAPTPEALRQKGIRNTKLDEELRANGK
jgi:hypothetical protein